MTVEVIKSGGGGATASTADYLMKALITAKGDLICGSAANTPYVLSVGGTAGYVLTVNGASEGGMTWATPGAGVPSGTTVAQTVFGAGSAAGTSGEFSRGDHAHGTPADPTTLFVPKAAYTVQSVVWAGTASVPVALEVAEQRLVGRLTGGNITAVTIGIADDNILQVDQYDAADNDFAKFTAAGIEGRSYAEVISDLSLGTMALAASADYASTATFAGHTTATNTHGAGTIASVVAVTALITTHASSTDAHIGGAGTVLSMAAGTVLITTHAGSTDAHIGGAGTIASIAAATVLITTHAGSTAAHIGGAGTVLSVAAATVLIKAHSDLTAAIHGVAAGSTIATTAEIATHAGLTATHGAGTIASVAAATALITTHANSTATHGVAGTIAAKSDIATDANLSAAAQTAILRTPTYYLVSVAQTVTGSVLASITGWVFAAATASKYVFEAGISNSCASTAGIWYGVTYSGSNATIEAQLIGTRAAATATACALTAFATKTGEKFTMVAATGAVYFTGLIETAGTAGNVQFQMCAGTAAATATIRKNSVLEVIKIV